MIKSIITKIYRGVLTFLLVIMLTVFMIAAPCNKALALELWPIRTTVSNEGTATRVTLYIGDINCGSLIKEVGSYQFLSLPSFVKGIAHTPYSIGNGGTDLGIRSINYTGSNYPFTLRQGKFAIQNAPSGFFIPSCVSSTEQAGWEVYTIFKDSDGDGLEDAYLSSVAADQQRFVFSIDIRCTPGTDKFFVAIVDPPLSMSEGGTEAGIAKLAAEAAKTAATNAATVSNYIKNNMLSISGGIVQDASGTVLQVARSNLTATNTANTTLGTVNTNVGTVKTDVSSLKTTVGTVNTNIGTINTNVNTVKSDVSSVKSTIGTVSNSVNTANNSINMVKSDVGTVKTDVSSVKTTIGTVNTTVGTVNTNVNKVNTNLTSVTNQINNEDYGLQALNTKIENIKSSVAPIILKAAGVNGATCTRNGSFTLVIQASGADQFRAGLDNSNITSSWSSSNTITISGIASGTHTIYYEAKNTNGVVAKGVLLVFSV